MSLWDDDEPMHDRHRMTVVEDSYVRKRMIERGYDVTRGTHGTKYIPGMTTVDPAEKVGKTVHEEYTRVNRVYYYAHPTDKADQRRGQRRDEPWPWAMDAAQKFPEETVIVDSDGSLTTFKVSGRPVVHYVEAVGCIDGDPVLNTDGESREMTADQLIITDTQWIPMPRSQDVGVQGTLPFENWNRYTTNPDRWADLNYTAIRETSQKDKDRIRFGEPPEQTRPRPVDRRQMSLFDMPRSRPELRQLAAHCLTDMPTRW